jgi:Group II intron, maturase-specific domain
MSDKRQKNQLQMALAFTGEGRSEAPRAPREGTESFTAKSETGSPAGEEQLMEEVCGRENCQQALRRVKANKGSPGIDGRRVSELPGYLKQHWPAVRELTRRTRGMSLEQMTKELASYLRGWKSYFGYSQTPSVLRKLEEWIRRRLRSVIWKQWKRSKVRYVRLRQRNIGHDLAAQTAGSPHGPWRLANSPALQLALPIAYFDSLGLPRLLAVL